jgi:hypothetical protein
MVEWAMWWDKTLARWYAEGLPKNLTDGGEISRYLGLDVYHQVWINARAKMPAPKHHGAGLVSTEREYSELKSVLFPEPAFDKKQLQLWSLQQQVGETVIWLTFDGFFWFPRELFGIERHLYAFFDSPDLIHQMNRDVLAYSLRALEQVLEVCTPTFVTFAEDLSYNHGPMLSHSMFVDFIAPYYAQIVPKLKDAGIITVVDSDGNVEEVIDWFIKLGIDGILPLERASGIDVLALRKRHPRFGMIGGFDKTIMKLGREAMRTEFERLLPVMKSGGFIPSVDHQTPPDVSLDNYRVYVELLKEYCIKATGIHI